MSDAAFSGGDALAELTGLSGAFVFPERLLQQIWLRGDFDARGLRLRDGRALRIVRRGRWNRLAGPDFREAEFRAGEGSAAETWRGDVEVHLRAVDWDRRLFDSLIPLPDGTTYNAYLVEGSQKTALY